MDKAEILEALAHLTESLRTVPPEGRESVLRCIDRRLDELNNLQAAA